MATQDFLPNFFWALAKVSIFKFESAKMSLHCFSCKNVKKRDEVTKVPFKLIFQKLIYIRARLLICPDYIYSLLSVVRQTKKKQRQREVRPSDDRRRWFLFDDGGLRAGEETILTCEKTALS